MQNRCEEIKLRAERRAGEILGESERKGLGRPEKTSQDVTLSDLGITRVQPHRWQAVGFLPPFRVFCARWQRVIPRQSFTGKRYLGIPSLVEVARLAVRR